MQIPNIFKPILWSYDTSKIDPFKMQKTIVVQALSYGNLEHWKWLKNFYGIDKIRQILASIPYTEMHSSTRALVEIIFKFKEWNYVPRGVRK